MERTIILRLTPSECAMLRSLIDFVEAGEVSGGPLEGMKHQQTTANIRVFNALKWKVWGA